MKNEDKDLGGTSLTEGDAVSVSVPTSTASHAAPTPGPWSVVLDCRSEGTIDVMYGDWPCCIANVDCRESADDDWDVPREYALANAHLIAAAPDLYAALKAVSAWTSLDGDGISEPVRSLVLAALAKADGQP